MCVCVCVLKNPKSHFLMTTCFCCSCCSAVSHVRLFAAPWTVALQPPLFMGFSRQEYESGLPCPLPGDLHDPGIEPMPLTSPAMAGEFFTLAPPGKDKETSNLRNTN